VLPPLRPLPGPRLCVKAVRLSRDVWRRISSIRALVTLVGPDVGGSDVVGIYRVDGPNNFTVIADIGEFALNSPPDTDFVVPTGLQ
jgi:hypothetical protein